MSNGNYENHRGHPSPVVEGTGDDDNVRSSVDLSRSLSLVASLSLCLAFALFAWKKFVAQTNKGRKGRVCEGYRTWRKISYVPLPEKLGKPIKNVSGPSAKGLKILWKKQIINKLAEYSEGLSRLVSPHAIIRVNWLYKYNILYLTKSLIECK